MPTDISKNEKNPWKMMQLTDILKCNFEDSEDNENLDEDSEDEIFD